MAAHTDNSVFIEAPMELVWRRTNDVESWTELFDEYAEATVLDREDGRITFRLALHPDENGKVWAWVSERRLDEAARTTLSHRVETGPFKYMSLFWEYTEVAGGVRLRWVQDFEMKPGAPVDDPAMAARINGSSVRQQARIKKILEQAARDAELPV
ncbi:SRPBCC family protein [Amycolatopsis sp. PS_44_ISF1]|uniref:SRPBCC family protein n=1 Tax=Amycolatopsis sp. PS_44_ISF1 TaxID=2974917 RepID=UPI0028DEEF72|nr:SRPBCC family protein [Amycolatopsis sp. PS_44_ISF1]MDT8910106.1 SRPBCC family protein [Amycolatopsis sp. PS_44_ISF1]